ncbi:nonribosomal peptide synthetase MxaA [Candidatus Methylomicrobium oryzae]|jgi:mxaA protein|uniref:nonribosomal peptide synthetase MxaA n=1 Tax=Candidatus Methylomicrobium oryzae TaxID=2802053 RepID=UPI0019241094|nr:nonribosomal peptide synthetase MxaA [Methylomicrobium sp. RS1]MBL1262873.1 nonribosomal peptide synthetase MxaA [Methylomicrobium sp. RS1]
MKRLLILTPLLLLGCSGAPEEALIRFEVETPRPFGYVIGDEIREKILIETRSGITLNTASLPAEGPLNRWLNLNRVEVEQDGQRYRIDLRYQVFYAPLTVRTLTLPGFTLQFGSGGSAFNKEIPPWRFTMSPLRDLAVKSAEGGASIRPDSLPPQLDTRQAMILITAGSGAAAAAAGALTFLYGYFPALRRRTLFKQALKRLSRIPEKDMAEALRTVHRALNALNRQPLYQRQLAGFYEAHPEYRRLDSQLNWFFNYSNHYFFSRNVSATALDRQKLTALCQACRQIERGSR